MIARQEPLVAPGRSERLDQLLLAHHVAAGLAPMELLDGPVERRAVDHRVVGRHGHPHDMAELVLHRAGQVVVDPGERQDERLAGRTPRQRLRDGRWIPDRLDPVKRRDGTDRWLDHCGRQIESLEDEWRDAPGGRAAVVRRVGQDQLVARPRHRDVMSEEELMSSLGAAWEHEGFLSRDHEEARLAAGRETLRRFRLSQLEPGAVVPAYVEREFSFSLGGDRIRGRWDRVDIEPADDETGPPAGIAAPAPHADTIARTFELTGRERVTITDYKTSDVRDPAKARQRARDSLQLQIYAMAYEAVAGRLPDAVQLHFLDTGVIGRAKVDARRLARGRERIAVAAAGIRAGDETPRPSATACGYCPFRSICPASAAT